MRAAALVSRMLGAARVGAAIAPRAAAVPSFARPMSTSADPLDTLIRFRAHDGEEYYGLLSPDETKAKVAERGPAGMRISSTEKDVDVGGLAAAIAPRSWNRQARHLFECRACLPCRLSCRPLIRHRSSASG